MLISHRYVYTYLHSFIDSSRYFFICSLFKYAMLYVYKHIIHLYILHMYIMSNFSSIRWEGTVHLTMQTLWRYSHFDGTVGGSEVNNWPEVCAHAWFPWPPDRWTIGKRCANTIGFHGFHVKIAQNTKRCETPWKHTTKQCEHTARNAMNTLE